MKIVVDHIAGSRRGQRQEFDVADRLRFGRHPDNDVSFDAHRDLDASARHAELRHADGAFSLIDVGSSNGLLVDGERVTELAIEVGSTVEVEFGAGGPRVRLFVGDSDEIPEPPSASSVNVPVAPRAGVGWRAVVVLVVLMAVLAALAVVLVTRAQCGGAPSDDSGKVGNYAAPVDAMRGVLRENDRAVTPGTGERWI